MDTLSTAIQTNRDAVSKDPALINADHHTFETWPRLGFLDEPGVWEFDSTSTVHSHSPRILGRDSAYASGQTTMKSEATSPFISWEESSTSIGENDVALHCPSLFDHLPPLSPVP